MYVLTWLKQHPYIMHYKAGSKLAAPKGEIHLSLAHCLEWGQLYKVEETGERFSTGCLDMWFQSHQDIADQQKLVHFHFEGTKNTFKGIFSHLGLHRQGTRGKEEPRRGCEGGAGRVKFGWRKKSVSSAAKMRGSCNPITLWRRSPRVRVRVAPCNICKKKN